MSKKECTKHWLAQRVTAVLLIPLVIWLVYAIVDLVGTGHGEFTAWLSEPLHACLMIIFVLVGFYHALLGAENVVEDYIHHAGFKKFKLRAQKLFFLGATIACVVSIVKIVLVG